MMPWTFKALCSRDFREELTCLKRIKKVSFRSIKAVVRGVAPVLRNAKHFAKELKKINLNDADIYVYSYWINGLVLKTATLLPKAKVIKKVARAHRYDLYDEVRSAGYIPLKEKVINDIDELYLISEDGLEYVKNKHKENEEKYRLSYLGTKDYGLGPGINQEKALKIASCSFVIPVKRIEKIIGALSLVNEVAVEWTHFGGGQDLEKMKKLAEEKLGTKDNIDYKFYGYIKNAELMKYYKENRVDLFVNVSKHEGLPVSIMEAMSFGISIIATDVGSTRETIEEGVNGYLLSEEFEDEILAERIISYGKMSESRKKELSDSSRKIWENKFCASNNYGEFMKGLQ